MSVKKGRFLLAAASYNNQARRVLTRRGIGVRFGGRAGKEARFLEQLLSRRQKDDSAEMWMPLLTALFRPL